MAEKFKLEFNIDLGYGDIVIEGRDPSYDDLLTLPVVRWLHQKVGPLNYPREPREMLNGLGWIIVADWNMLEHWNRPRCHVLFDHEPTTQLITEFWMRFQR